jgi:AraC-like DNA-binding protein
MTTELAQAIERYIARQDGENPYRTEIPGLILLTADQARPPAHYLLRPGLCVVAQGAKWASIGGSQYEYRAGEALVVSVEMPSAGRVTAASPDAPFFGAVIEFDLAIMRAVLDELDTPPRAEGEPAHSVFVTDFAGPLEDCVLRLVRLLDTPKAITALAPMIMREICFWLLTGPHGGAVVRATLEHGHPARVIRAIHALRDRYLEPVRVAELAGIAKLSPSAFHRQFKTLTSMTPLQYQKQLRLLEARRLMVAEAANVETAAFAVGYESPSQFSREYSRLFGASPKRDSRTITAVPQIV